MEYLIIGVVGMGIYISFIVHEENKDRKRDGKEDDFNQLSQSGRLGKQTGNIIEEIEQAIKDFLSNV